MAMTNRFVVMRRPPRLILPFCCSSSHTRSTTVPFFCHLLLLLMLFLCASAGVQKCHHCDASVVQHPSHHHHHHSLSPSSFPLSSSPSPSSSAAARPAIASSEIRFMQLLFRRYQRAGDHSIGTSAVGYTPTAISVKRCGGVGGSDSSKVHGWALKFALNKLAPTERYVRAELHLHGPLGPFLDAKRPTPPSPSLHIVQFVCRGGGDENGRGAQRLGKNDVKPSRKIDHWLDGWRRRIGDDDDDGMEADDQPAVDHHHDHHRHSRMKSGGDWWTVFDAMAPLVYATAMDDDNRGEEKEEDNDTNDDDDGTQSQQDQQPLYINLYRYRRPLGEYQLRRFIHKHRPFLVLYTEEAVALAAKNGDAQNGVAQTSTRPRRAKRDIRATLSDYDDARTQMDMARKTAEYFSYGMAKGNNNNNVNDVGGAQVLLENGASGQNTVFGTLRRLNRRRKMKDRKSKNKQTFPRFDPNDPMLGFGTPFSPWQRVASAAAETFADQQHAKVLLQSPNVGTSLNDIRGLNDHGYSWTTSDHENATNSDGGTGASTVAAAAAETKLFIMDEKKRTQKSDERCSWHNMTVDFNKLGWSDRIIAPKSFEAGFCAGHCAYPLENDSNPSNHAILQTLIVAATQRQQHHHQLGEVPAAATQPRQPSQPATTTTAPPPTVCCAPEKFDSLTLLYYDERDNVVLKNFPRMVVLSCGCL